MAEVTDKLHEFDHRMVWIGFTKLAPISLFVAVFGAAFGLAATQAGLSDAVIVAMSTLVFAGAAQFAALELWGPEVSLLTLSITVFAINARHLLMGATLYPWLQHLSVRKRYGVMLVASDANWGPINAGVWQQAARLGALAGRRPDSMVGLGWPAHGSVFFSAVPFFVRRMPRQGLRSSKRCLA